MTNEYGINQKPGVRAFYTVNVCHSFLPRLLHRKRTESNSALLFFVIFAIAAVEIYFRRLLFAGFPAVNHAVFFFGRILKRRIAVRKAACLAFFRIYRQASEAVSCLQVAFFLSFHNLSPFLFAALPFRRILLE